MIKSYFMLWAQFELFLLLTLTAFLSGVVGNIYTHTGNIQFLFNNEHRSVLFIQHCSREESMSWKIPCIHTKNQVKYLAGIVHFYVWRQQVKYDFKLRRTPWFKSKPTTGSENAKRLAFTKIHSTPFCYLGNVFAKLWIPVIPKNPHKKQQTRFA